MREPPRLADATIQAALRAHYGLSTSTLRFLPIGNDSASFVYRVEAGDGTTYFLKARADQGFRPSSLLIPRFLFEQGVPHIVAPLPTVEGTLWLSLDDFALSLYPFIDARPAADTGLSQQQWHELGTTLRQIHASQLPDDLPQIVRRETFTPSRRQLLTDVESLIATDNLADAFQRELSAFWRARQDEIRSLIARADALGDQLRQTLLPLVLCHADLHTWNVLLDTAGQIWIVDCDEIVFAPKERDLMFVIGGIGRDLVRQHETTCFVEGYGDQTNDRRALVYYRYAWAVQDMAAYVEDIFFAPDRGEQTRSDALRGFVDLFAPGNIVAIARASDSDTL